MQQTRKDGDGNRWTAAQVRALLMDMASRGNKPFTAALLPGVPGVLGLRIPELRRLARRIARDGWRQYLAHASHEYMEERMLHGLVIAYVEDITLDERFGWLRDFVPLINSWSVCDSVCATFKPKAAEREAWWLFLQPYLQSDEEYALRFGIVMALMNFVDGEHVNLLFDAFTRIRHEGYYVKMAVAWALSVCYVHFPQETYAYLQTDVLDDLTHQQTIQKIVDSYRVDKDEKQRVKALRRRR